MCAQLSNTIATALQANPHLNRLPLIENDFRFMNGDVLGEGRGDDRGDGDIVSPMRFFDFLLSRVGVVTFPVLTWRLPALEAMLAPSTGLLRFFEQLHSNHGKYARCSLR